MAPKRECVVCAESKGAVEFPDAPLTSRCEHSQGTCLNCVSRAIRAQISNESSTDVSCPECTGILTYENVQRYADSETRQRHDEACVRRALEQDDDFIWCAAGCGSGQIHNGGLDQPIVKCGSCGGQTCFLHKVPWHTGMTCDEWSSLLAPSSTANETFEETLLRRARELRASKETIERTTKSCPKCAWNIEKNGGW